MMLYISYTLSYGRSAGWATVAGITSAFVVHISATILGLTALLLAFPVAYNALKYAGIAYLLWIAFRNLRGREWAAASAATAEKKHWSYFYLRGFVGNILNPQTTILYFSLLPQFIDPAAGQVWLQNIKLGAVQMLGSTATNMLLVWVVGGASGAFLQNPRYQRIIRYTMSALLAAFAIKLIFAAP